ncbi:MAG: hypothetical protein JXB00_14320 [Bacteroidales bacterium]|nr:hypothetical protein [Bacteroidales bacterium]
MKLTLLISGLLLCMAGISQNYTRDAGLRFGTLNGITYRQYLGEIKAIEAQSLIGKDGLRFRIMRQFFQPAFNELSDNLYFTYGYGAHAGISRYSNYKFLTRNYSLSDRTVGPLIGLDAYLGLEYNVREYPLIIELSFIPFFEFSTNRFFYILLDDTAISIKYKF